jgi:polyhydroxybutyrate depolymerase
MSERIAAVAPVSAGHVAFNHCEIDNPVSVIVFHGTEDRIIPYGGNQSDIPSVQMWVEAWAERNGCAFPAERSTPYDGFLKDSWVGCDGNVEVVLYTVEGGEHEWPIIEMGTHLDGYASSTSATDEIWEFFKTHPKKTP